MMITIGLVVAGMKCNNVRQALAGRQQGNARYAHRKKWMSSITTRWQGKPTNAKNAPKFFIVNQNRDHQNKK